MRVLSRTRLSKGSVPETGWGRFFRRTARQVKTTVGEAGEYLDEGEEGPQVGEGSEDTEGTGTAATAQKKTSEVTKRYLGVGKSAREWARKLDVDPYTSSEALGRELDRVASAASVGRFGACLAMPDLGVADYLGEVNDLVWTLSAADLEVMNRKRLKKMGLEKAEIEALFANPAISPTRLTGLVAALHGIEGVPGRAHLVRAAGAAASEEEALFFERSAQLLRAYHGEVASLCEIVSGGAWGGGITAEGRIVMALALDYVPWTEDAATALTEAADRFRSEAGVERMELWLAGRVSPLAHRELERQGWQVEERVRERLLDQASPQSSTPGRSRT